MYVIDHTLLAYQNKSNCDKKGQNVTPHRFVILPIALAEPRDIRVEAVLAESLEDFRGGHQAGQSRGQGRRKAASIDEWSEGRHYFHHLQVFKHAY